MIDPGFYDRVRLYLKPTEVGEFWVFLILIFDWIIAALFVGCQFHYILNGEFSNMSEKTMQVIIGVGITTCICCYAIADAIRFLPRWADKVLYTVSCLMLKPILLPIILGGYCFKSPLREHS
jgi:hypothetical protein